MRGRCSSMVKRVVVHERARRRAADAKDEVSSPMAGNGAFSPLRWTLTDHDLGGDKAFASVARVRPRDPQRSAAAQAGGELASQTAAALDEQCLVDSLAADPHGHIVREVNQQAARDLLWTPRPRPSSFLPPSMPAPLPRHRHASYGGAARSDDHAGQRLLHISAQGRIERKLCRPGPACRSLRRRRAILLATAAGGRVSPQPREIVDAARLSRRATSCIEWPCARIGAISSRSAHERQRPDNGSATAMNMAGAMPPAFRTHRAPTAWGTPAETAASSLDTPAAIAAQNSLRSSSPATGGQPGDGKAATSA